MADEEDEESYLKQLNVKYVEAEWKQPAVRRQIFASHVEFH